MTFSEQLKADIALIEPALEKYGDCQVRCWNYDGKTLKEESEA